MIEPNSKLNKSYPVLIFAPILLPNDILAIASAIPPCLIVKADLI